MQSEKTLNRRTVLQALGTSAIGGATLTGLATADSSSPTASQPASDLTITGKHDHANDEHFFELSTPQITEGWSTITFDNQTDHTHFAYIAKLPQQALDDAAANGMTPRAFYYETVTRPFQYFMDTLAGNETDPEDLAMVCEVYGCEESIFPPWFPKVQPSGGTGLTSGGEASHTTVQLDPGTYLAECYVKNSSNVFHSYLEMFETFEVTSGGAGTQAAPTATHTLELSSDGMQFPSWIFGGEQTFEVRFEDQSIYDHLLGHDAHLVKLSGTSAEEVNGWMNWASPTQFISDGSEPSGWLGGIQNIRTPGLLAGTGSESAYVHADLRPGEYAWVAEVPDPKGKDLLKRFMVAGSR